MLDSERWAAFANIGCCSAAALIRPPYRYAARRAAGGPPRQSPPLTPGQRCRAAAPP